MLVLLLFPSKRVLESVEHLFSVQLPGHVDEVKNDYPPDVSQPQLVSDFFHRLQVGFEYGLLQVALAHIATGVDINCGEGLGLFR